MPEKLYALTENEIRLLKEFIRKNQLSRTPRYRDNTIDNEEMSAPEVYIALTPATGIPALDQREVGYDRAGYTDCFIYKIVEETAYDEFTGTGTGTEIFVGTGTDTETVYELQPVDDVNFYKRIYNLEGIRIAPDQWINVEKDKYGNWIVGRHRTFSGVRLFMAGPDGPFPLQAYNSGLPDDTDSVYWDNNPVLGSTFFPEVLYDTDSYHQTTVEPSKLYVPCDGYYHVEGRLAFALLTDYEVSLVASLRVNGVPTYGRNDKHCIVRGSDALSTAAAQVTEYVHTSDVIRMYKGDFVELRYKATGYVDGNTGTQQFSIANATLSAYLIGY